MSAQVSDPMSPGALQAALERPAGMVPHHDRNFLRDMGQHNWTGRGAVVDAGSLIGASACSLAAGLLSSRRAVPDGSLHCYDHFEVREPYVLDFFRRMAAPVGTLDAPVALGWQFRDLFDVQTNPFRRLITAHEGDIADQDVPAEIELMLLDVCTDEANNSVAMRKFFPHLLEGAVIVYKEYMRPWHPFVPVSVGLLRDHLEPVRGGYEARAFRVVRRIDAAAVEAADPSRLPPDEQDAVLVRMAATAEGRDRAWVQACRARSMQLHGAFDACIALATDILEAEPAHPYAAELENFRGRSARREPW